MITNPFAGRPGEAGWAMGFAAGYTGPAFSVAPPAVLAPETVEAFNQGVLAGQRAAIDGVVVSPDCVDTSLDSPSLASEGGKAIEIGLIGIDIRKGFVALKSVAKVANGFAGAALGAVVFLIGLGAAASDFRSPEEALPELTEKFLNQLSQLGIEASFELFVGAAIDNTIDGCQLRLTRVFKSQNQAVAAAKALGRRDWVVARWRTDASGSLEIIDASD